MAAPAAAAGSLPSVRSGKLPGPPLLYAKAPRVPQLENRAPFRARPLLVSGTDAYRRGEYVYQDYLFDDHGADTGVGSSPPGVAGFSPSVGDLLYPTAARYANNAADLVELRIKPTAKAIVYRVTLGAVLADDATVVGIGIDTDRDGGGSVPWPRGAGLSSPGLDRFITAWGTGGEVTGLPGGGATALARGRREDRQAHQPDDDPRAAQADGPAQRDLALRRRHRALVGQPLPGPGRGHPRGVQPRLPLRRAAAARRRHLVRGGAGRRRSASGPRGGFHADVDFARLAAGANALDPRARAQAGAHLLRRA